MTDALRRASRRFGPSLVVLIVGLGTTLLLTQLYYSTQFSRARVHFSAWCEERQQLLSKSIDANVETLHGLRALFDASEFVTPEEFRRFTSNAVRRHQDVRALGYVRQVTQAQRPAFEAFYSKLLGKPFHIVEWTQDNELVPAASRPLYAPLVYVQTKEDVPLGLDARIVPRVATAMDAAARSDDASASITAARVGSAGPSRRVVQIYLPVYESSGAAGMEPTQRGRHDVEGFVRLRFGLEEIAEGIAAQARSAGIEMRLLEEGPGIEAADIGAGEIIELDGWSNRRKLEWHGGIAVADRMLSMQLRATDRYMAAQQPLLPVWSLLVAGLAATILGALATFYLTRSRLRTESMSRDLEAEIRERRLSEQRSAQSEERYRILVEHSPDAIILIRRDRAIFVNAAAVELFRAKDEQDLVGREVTELVHPDFREVARERVERMMRDGNILPPFEERLMRLDGTIVDVEVRSVPFVSDGEKMMQVTLRDIAFRLAAERERMSLETALRQSQRLEAIGTLTGGIAHDFNNILSSIVGNIRLVMDDLPKGHPARQAAHEIRNATNRARDLVKRLMTFSRQQEAPQTPLELDVLIDEVQQLLRPTLPAGVVLHSVVPPDTPPVIADATQLHQVLVNLCTNAWQAMPSGRGEIRILVETVSADEARRQSRVDLAGASRYVCIEVSDNGSGIPAEILDRIFDPFFTTKPAGEGSGLGLAVVHGIVQSHQGAIVASSSEGKGSSFRVYLRASDHPAEPASSAIPGAHEGANQHVLYVDDEEPLVVLVTRILERNGYRCTATTDPREAIEMIQKNPAAFDLVLTDMNMPGLSGIDVAREVLAQRPDLPVVITTGYVRASDIAATKSLGIRALVLKPDTIDELAALVARYLHQPVPNV